MFEDSIELTRRQGAGSFELRATTDLGVLLCARGKREQAKGVLQQVYDRFTEGFDLKAAAELIHSLG